MLLHIDINNGHVNTIMLHDDILYLACTRQKYATIEIYIKKNVTRIL